ncbi:MAG: 23S rRNA (uridine(2552)-2'-O)-methyltransferase RlmE [Methylococcales bacterium]|nr:23S rRNA (uridine(2552)-2'-O)-methyltransferase RlmE [Methylococcales bacterium]
MMAHSKSSKRWLHEHFNDVYVKRSQAENWRSRAVFKLQEIDQRDQLFKPGAGVVDLGAAPGGWSQYAVKKVGDSGFVIASDILAMEPLPGVDFIQGDFQEQTVFEQLLGVIDGRPVDVVLSDMAPNLSGNKSIDQPRSLALVELALDTACQVLSPGGHWLAKAFQGQGFDALKQQLKPLFQQVVIRKPDASRARSQEVYLLARHFQGGNR